MTGEAERKGAERVLHVVGKEPPTDPNEGADSPLCRKHGAVIAYYADGPKEGQVVVITDDCDYVIELDGTVYA